MVKFILGLVVGLICGVVLTAVLPLAPNASNQYEVARTDNTPGNAEGSKQATVQKEHRATSYKTMANAFDEETQRQWKKITGDPVWDQLADEDKMHIWAAFEKVYVSTNKTHDNKG